MEIESLELDPNASLNMSCLLQEEKKADELSSKMALIKNAFIQTRKQDPMQQPMQAASLGERARVHGETSISLSADSDGNKKAEAEAKAKSEDEKTEVSAKASIEQNEKGEVKTGGEVVIKRKF